MKEKPKDDTALVAAVAEDACTRLGAIDRVPLIVVVSAQEYDEIGDHPFVQLLTMIEVAEEGNPSAFRRAKELIRKLSGAVHPRSWRAPAGQEGSHA
jgi:hypothetical protein